MTNYKLISIDAINELIHFKFTYEIAKDYPPMCYKEITRKSRVLTKDILAMFDNAPSVECEPIGWTTKVQLSFLDNGEVMLVYPADTCEAEIPIYTTPQDQSAKIAELEADKQKLIEALDMSAEDAKDWAMQYVTEDNAPVNVKEYVSSKFEKLLAEMKKG